MKTISAYREHANVKFGAVKIGGTSFLFGVLMGVVFGFFNLYFGFIAWFVGMWIMAGGLYYYVNRKWKKWSNTLAVVGSAERITHTEKEDIRRIQEERVEWKPPQPVDIGKYLARKGQNRIIAVMGKPRSGKSQLLYWLIQNEAFAGQKKIIFQLKATDDYVRLGYPVLYIHKAVPNCFKSAKAFTRAFTTAFAISAGMHGITAATLEGEVKKIAEGCGSWDDFQKRLDDKLKSERDNITRSALRFIENSISLVYSENMLDYELPDSCVIDFEGDAENEIDTTFYSFYAEYILNQLSGEVWTTRENTMFVVDEAHLLTKSGHSVIPSMSALISAKSSMILASQRIADLAGQALDSCATQFTFRQDGEENLREVRHSVLLQRTVAEFLRPYEFCDKFQMDIAEGLLIFELVNPKPVMHPIVELNMFSKKTVRSEVKDTNNIDYQSEVIALLNEPCNQQDLAKRFVEKYGKDVNFWKLSLKRILKDIDEVSFVKTDYVKFAGNEAYLVKDSKVFFRKGTYDYHDWLVSIVAEILTRKGLKAVKQQHGEAIADVIDDERKVAVEVETGSKFGAKMQETKARIAQYEREGYRVIVIVPNDDVAEKYAEHAPLTALELWTEEAKFLYWQEEVKANE